MGWKAALVVLFVASFGLLAFVAGARQTLIARRLRRVGVRVPGIVVAVRVESGEQSNSYYPTLRFHGPDGRERAVESDVSSVTATREGQRVTVLYDPTDPRRARVAGLADDGTLHGVIFLGIGSVILAGVLVWGLVTAMR